MHRESPFRAGSSEFPHDNPAVDQGALWIGTSLCSVPAPAPAEKRRSQRRRADLPPPPAEPMPASLAEIAHGLPSEPATAQPALDATPQLDTIPARADFCPRDTLMASAPEVPDLPLSEPAAQPALETLPAPAPALAEALAEEPVREAAPRSRRARRRLEAPPAADLPAAEPAIEAQPLPAEPAIEPALEAEPAPAKPAAFSMYVDAVVDVTKEYGGTEAAAQVARLLGGDVPDLRDEAVAMLVDGQILEPGTLQPTDTFLRLALAWKSALSSDGGDLSGCGETTLDNWTADLVSRLLAQPAKANTIRRDLRRHGVAAFGMLD
jgi:ribonuclease E